MTITDAYDENALAVTINIVHSRTLDKLGESILERVSDAFYAAVEGMQVTFPGESEEEQEENLDDFVANMTNKFLADLAKGE